VIMLTPSAGSRIGGGLGEGADDYLVKPFAPPSCSARIRAVLRRTLAAIGPGAERGAGRRLSVMRPLAPCRSAVCRSS
jgi:DNA-binding response OmpR family regulator